MNREQYSKNLIISVNQYLKKKTKLVINLLKKDLNQSCIGDNTFDF